MRSRASGWRVVLVFVAWLMCCPAGATGASSVLEDFMARRPSSPGGLAAAEALDFNERKHTVGMVYRLEVDITKDGAAEMFLAVGPTGKDGTTWFVYSPGPTGRYQYVGEMFFHPSSFCYLVREGVFRVGSRCGERDPATGDVPWGAVDFAISRAGIRRTGMSSCGSTARDLLEDLSSCAASAGAVAASAYDTKHGRAMWMSLQTWTHAPRQPKPLAELVMAP